MVGVLPAPPATTLPTTATGTPNSTAPNALSATPYAYLIPTGTDYMRAPPLGDTATVRACYHPDAKLWHNNDGIEQTVDQNMKVLDWFIRALPDRAGKDRRREDVVQHYLCTGCMSKLRHPSNVDERLHRVGRRLEEHRLRRLRQRRAPLREIHGDDLVEMCFTSADFAEGVSSFLAKRPAEWKGR